MWRGGSPTCFPATDGSSATPSNPASPRTAGGPSGSIARPAGLYLHRGIQNYAKWFAYYRTRMQNDEDLVGISFRGFISNPTRHAAQARQSARGLHHDSRRGHRQRRREPVPENQQFQHDAGEQPLHQVLPADSGASRPCATRFRAPDGSSRGKLNTGLTNGIPAGDDPMQSSARKTIRSSPRTVSGTPTRGRTLPAPRWGTGTIRTVHITPLPGSRLPIRMRCRAGPPAPTTETFCRAP